MNDRRLDKAKLEWGASDDAPHSLFPKSTAFDDVYFSGDGPAETTHVFLAGNHLPMRFENARRFHIGELGFGTGLNLLVAWDAWKKANKPANAKLSFLSVEAFPLATEDMARAHEAWPALATLSETLRNTLPPPHPGFHQINLDQDVTLTLYYGDALRGFSQCEGQIDAWFLDGFAPARNPEMWSAELFSELARLSSPNATFATFTVAGGVRRSLEHAGFAWRKTPGFGRKREMLTGQLESDTQSVKRRAPWFAHERQTLPSGGTIAIIGAGVAGASLAHELTRAGFTPSVYESNDIASGASGNPAGLIMPRLDLGDTPAGRFHATAYLHTLKLIEQLQRQTGKTFYTPCGVARHATTEKENQRQQKLNDQPALPEGWLELQPEGLFFPQGGVIDPKLFVRALLGSTQIIPQTATQLVRRGEKWRILTSDAEAEYDSVILASGLNSLRFEQARTLPLAGSAGQVDWFPNGTPPKSAHAFGPYAGPVLQGGVVIGATYAPIAIGREARFTPEATQSNIAAIARRLPETAQSLDPAQSIPRASVRCTTPDRLPVVGPVPDWTFYAAAYDDLRLGKKRDYPPAQIQNGLYILTGLGSRGLVTAPVAAAMIAAELSGAPAPVDLETAQALHPARFFIRDYKRAKHTK